MKNTESLCLVVINILLGATSCTSYPTSLEKNFQLAGKTQSELKKVILHYSTHLTDSLKRKAVLFLIKNMDAHVSYANKSCDDFQKEPDTFYKKEDRPSKLIKGFKALYAKYADGLQDITYMSDLKTIYAQFLINNINQAFHIWKSPYCNYLNFADFGEYILPYCIATKPFSDRIDYQFNALSGLIQVSNDCKQIAI